MPKENKSSLEAVHQDVTSDVVKMFSSIVVDFELIEGSMYLCIYNLSDEPYLNVNITPGKEIHGSNNRSTTDQLTIFKEIRYLAPHKCFRIFLDIAELFFQKQTDMIIPFNVDYRNAAKQSFKYSFVQDLAVYRDLPTHSTAYNTTNH